MNTLRIFLLVFLSVSTAVLPLKAQPKHEIRATWLTTLGGLDWPTTKANTPQRRLKQQQELCDLLDRLKEAHFNTVLYQARIRGDVAYPSKYEAFTEAFTGHAGQDPGYDPLAFTIEECHKRGMELHAWVVTIPVGNERQIRTLGTKNVVRQHPKLCKKYHNVWYLDPGQPGTADYLSGIVTEIVSRYDVDGIHFDYIRYPEHSPKFPDKDTYRRYGQQQDWKDWRRNNITRIVRRLYTDIKRLKPWVKVSSSPVGKYNDTRRYTSKGWNAYDIVFQDAQLWIQQGIHDALFPMMYFQGNHFYPFAIDWKEHDNHRWIVPGLGIYFLHPSEGKWKLDEVVRQLYFLRSIQADGQAYFRNRFLMDNTQGLMDEIKDEFYTAPAVWPAMTWQDSIPPTVPTGPTLRFEDGVTQLGWNASTDNSIPFSVYYRIYASNSYPVDTEQASTLVEARVADTCFTYRPSAPWLQKIYWAVTAVDRYGNESQPLALNAPTDLQPEVLQQLPSIPEGGTLIIADLTGKEILRLTNDTAPFEKLGTGFYRVSLKTSDGKIHLLGTILR